MAAGKPKHIPKNWKLKCFFFQIRERVVGHGPDPSIIILTMSCWDIIGGWGGIAQENMRKHFQVPLDIRSSRAGDEYSLLKNNKIKEFLVHTKVRLSPTLRLVGRWPHTGSWLTSWHLPPFPSCCACQHYVGYNDHSIWRSMGAALIHWHNMTYRNISCSQSRGSVFHTVECELRRKEPHCGAMINFVSV